MFVLSGMRWVTAGLYEDRQDLTVQHHARAYGEAASGSIERLVLCSYGSFDGLAPQQVASCIPHHWVDQPPTWKQAEAMIKTGWTPPKQGDFPSWDGRSSDLIFTHVGDHVCWSKHGLQTPEGSADQD